MKNSRKQDQSRTQNVMASAIVSGVILLTSIFFGACGPDSTSGPGSTKTNANLDAEREGDSTPAPFVVNGETCANQREFIEGGRRCGTTPPSEFEIRDIQNRLQEFRSAFRVTEGEELHRAPGSIVIRVYFHVINKGPGIENGDIPESWMNEQIAVLNRAYAGQGPGGTGAATPFSFVLTGIDRTTNAAWFNAKSNTAEE